MASGFADTFLDESHESSDSSSGSEDEIQVYILQSLTRVYNVPVVVVLSMQIHVPKSKSMPMQRKGAILHPPLQV